MPANNITERFIVQPGVNRYTKKRCFFVRDTHRASQRTQGVDKPLNTKEEADYLAWALNNKQNSPNQSNY
jgi:hypothetical protein